MLTDADVLAIRGGELPASERFVHLKASGGSPMCRSAHDACQQYLHEMCFEGDIHFDRYLERLDEGRGRVADYLGCPAASVGYTVNASAAASIMAEMLVRSGVQRVYHPVGEFPTSVHAVVRQGIPTVAVGDVRYRDAPGDWLDAVAGHLSANPLVGQGALVISHVSFISGETVDIPSVGRFATSHGLILVVNATQSFGALEIDVGSGVDGLFATGLKWAFAGYGAGLVYLRPKWVDTVGMPNRGGWLGVTDPYRMYYGNTALRQGASALDADGGMPHFGPLMALNGALSLYERLGGGDIRAGVALVQERVRYLARYLGQSLAELGYVVLGSGRIESGIVSISTPQAPRLFDRLREAGILASLRRHPLTGEADILRFGVHFFNVKKELDLALSVLR